MPTINFQSTNHKRYENGVCVSHDFVPRYIKLDYSSNGALLTISVLPTLSPKQAVFAGDDGSILIYKGIDPDYRFEVETKADNTIYRVSVFRLDRNLELRYFG